MKCGCLNYIFLEYYLASNMENHVTSASLKLKLTLLKALKEGNVEQSQQLLEQLSTINHSHPQLYEKFHSFISEHKAQIIEDNQAEKEQMIKPIIVDKLSDDSWVTDQSAQWSESEDQVEVNEKKIKKVESKPKLLKNVMNSKSAINLKPVKQIKRPFHVQTKPKENTNSSTANIRRQSSPSQKMIASDLGAITTLSKTTALSKLSSKKTIKSYFPSITNKPALRLN